MALESILSDLSVSMAEFKANPNKVLRESLGEAVAIISNSKPAFYMVPAERYEVMLDEIDDLQLAKVAERRLKQKGRAIEVKLADL